MSEFQAESYLVLNAVAAPAASDPVLIAGDGKTFHVTGTTTAGAGAASIVVEVSNETTWPWITLATIALTLGVTAVADGVAMQAGWKYVRVRLVSISGTGATVSASTGI